MIAAFGELELRFEQATEADVEAFIAHERIAGETKTWLCRCGQSGKKPFCDGAHKKVGFKFE